MYIVNVNRNLNIKLISSSVLIWLIAVYIIYLLPNYDFTYAIFYCIFYCIVLAFAWHGNGRRLTPFILFLISIGLFLGGRFWGYILNPQDDIFSLRWYAKIYHNHSQKNDLMIYFTSFLFSILIGYLYGYTGKHIKYKEYKIPSYIQKNIQRIVSFSIFLFIPLILINGINKLALVASQGYVALYLSNQTEDYSSGSGFITVLFFIFFGLAFGFCEKHTKIMYIALYLINSLFSIIMGSRGSFGVVLLILIWLYSLHHKVSIKKLMFMGATCLVILLSIFSLSIRSQNSIASATDVSLFDTVSTFVFGQGITLMVFEASRMIDQYPTLAYIQSIIPGSSFFYSIITGQVLRPEDVSLSSYMCYNLNSGLFSEGYGLGWSIMSDFFLFGGRTLIGFILLSLFWGFFIANIELKSHISKWYKSLLFTIVSPLLVLPRSGMNTFATMIIYCCIIYFMLMFIINLSHKLRSK